MSELQYPIGKFSAPTTYTAESRARLIDDLTSYPARLGAAVAGRSDAQLDTPYRPGGWTVRQVVHHIADANVNGYVRCKLAVTADLPAISPYAEERWAELADGKSGPVSWSLDLLGPLHERWVAFLRTLSAAEFERAFSHPVAGPTTVDRALALYSWHGDHHLAHITALTRRMGW